MDRAQLLSGLRTGGPRSNSGSYGQMPMTAGPTSGSFARFQMGADSQLVDDASDALAQLSLQNALANSVDPRFMQYQAQQTALIAQNLATGNITYEQAQNLQLQMKMELLRLQSIQQQQQNLQAQLLLQAQLQQHQQKPVNRRPSNNQLMTPNSAAPFQTSFDVGAATPGQTRFNAAATLRARALNREQAAPASPGLGNGPEEANSPGSPMTPSSAGRFANRVVSGNVATASPVGSGSPLNPHAAAFVGRFNPESINTAVGSGSELANDSPAKGTPQTPTAYGATTVISGGTYLGGSTPTHTNSPSSYNGLTGYNNANNGGLSKSDSVSSWRKAPATPNTGSPSPSPLSSKPPTRSGSASPPKIGALNLNTSGLPRSTGTVMSPNRARPSPLTLRSDSQDSTHSSIPSVAISSHSSDNGDVDAVNDGASHKSASPTSSSPPTSAGSGPGASNAREEATKRLYEGLGIGRPVPSPVNASFTTGAPRAAPPNVVTNLITQRSLSLNTNFPFQIPTVSTTAPTPIPPSAGGLSAGVQGRVVSQPQRQPRGPPTSVDELGNANFASRIRKQAVGGLNVLMDARERRVSHGASTAEVVAF